MDMVSVLNQDGARPGPPSARHMHHRRKRRRSVPSFLLQIGCPHLPLHRDPVTPSFPAPPLILPSTTMSPVDAPSTVARRPPSPTS